MLDPKILDEISKRITESMPEGLVKIKQDMEDNMRAGIEKALARLNLVTREEFDVQSAVLARTREKLEALEKQVAELEKRLLETQ